MHTILLLVCFNPFHQLISFEDVSYSLPRETTCLIRAVYVELEMCAAVQLYVWQDWYILQYLGLHT